MPRSTRFKVLWTIWMSVGGLVVAFVTYRLTERVGWTVIALLASGVALNAIGQMVTQPFLAARGEERPRSPGTPSPT